MCTAAWLVDSIDTGKSGIFWSPATEYRAVAKKPVVQGEGKERFLAMGDREKYKLFAMVVRMYLDRGKRVLRYTKSYY